MAEAAGIDADHLGSGNRMCSVVFADIVQYSQKLVSQQVTLKARFSALLAAALEHTAAADRLVVDTGDGNGDDGGVGQDAIRDHIRERVDGCLAVSQVFELSIGIVVENAAVSAVIMRNEPEARA